jgi:hypothetical protein
MTVSTQRGRCLISSCMDSRLTVDVRRDWFGWHRYRYGCLGNGFAQGGVRLLRY